MRVRFEFIVLFIAFASVGVYMFNSYNDDSVGAASRILPRASSGYRAFNVTNGTTAPTAPTPYPTINRSVTKVYYPSIRLCGDIDGSGAVNIGDSLVLSQFLAGIVELRPPYSYCADVNSNRILDQMDVTLIARYSSGISSALNCTRCP